ncbi:MAG TPA: formyltransferase family protein, partial [Acidimicrobiales bacterium]
MRLAVLASGGGSILDAILTAGVPVEVVLVDRPCGAQDVAAHHGVGCELVARDSFGPSFDRLAYTEDVIDLLQANGVDLIVMAGWGTIFDKPIFDAFDGRILNTHPALLPAFPGWHAVRDALAYGVKVSGVTVHVATLEVDA